MCKIAKLIAEEGRNKAFMFNNYTGNSSSICLSEMWKLKKKLSPANHDPPTAMKDQSGNILTTDDDIKKQALTHYENVYKYKPMEEHIKHTKEQRK